MEGVPRFPEVFLAWRLIASAILKTREAVMTGDGARRESRECCACVASHYLPLRLPNTHNPSLPSRLPSLIPSAPIRAHLQAWSRLPSSLSVCQRRLGSLPAPHHHIAFVIHLRLSPCLSPSLPR